MKKLIYAVCVTVLLSILAPAEAIASARPQKKSIVVQRNTPVKKSLGIASKTSRGKVACKPCEASLASRKGRSSRKHARSSQPIACHPKDYVDPKIARNYKSAMRDMKRAGIKPNITSVWRSSEAQAELRRCSLSTSCRRANPGLYRALPAGKSMHEAGFAVDISGIAAGPRGGKKLTPQGRRIVGIMHKNGFKWRYGLSDPAHFEADPRRYGYRDAQQAITRTQSTCQFKLAGSRTRKKSVAKIAT